MKIVVIAGYPMVREGIISIISNQNDIEFSGEATTVREGLKLLEVTKPDIALVDANLGGKNGLEFIIAAKQRRLLSKFILMGFYRSKGFISKALEMEVEGYILREAHPEEILHSIRQVYRGKKYYDSDLLKYINLRNNEDILGLTSREKEVLMAVSKGLSNKQIAKSLFITEHTVKKHVSQILSKLELSDRTQAAIFANSIGLSS